MQSRRVARTVLYGLGLLLLAGLIGFGPELFRNLAYREISRSRIRSPYFPEEVWHVRLERRFSFLKVPSPLMVFLDDQGRELEAQEFWSR